MINIYHLTRRQHVRKPLAEVFAFFERPENLAALTPPNLGFLILTPPPLEMRAGALIDYTIEIAGMHVHWRTIISCYHPPHRFVDEQLKGPYLFWHHTHQFQETDDGTLIIDDVRYALPFGFLGKIIHSLIVGRKLQTIFDYRAQQIHRFFSATVIPLTNNGPESSLSPDSSKERI